MATHSAYATPDKKAVELSNNDDCFYVQRFKTRAELQVFIDSLCALRDEVWPVVDVGQNSVEQKL
jgi:hypothetical protein